ncbi:nitroreductase family protein, partial [Streptomyces scabiei]|uniref:nitroreductase family protein n=1 Tax=Streptomyces scabiei TaxID=1930 RepID=UPI0038F61079
QFIIVEGEGRDRLGEIYYKSAVTEQQDEKVISRAKELPLRAPMIIIAIAKYQQHPKVPRIEQVQSAGCAVLAMQQAAFAQGLGGVWRT